MKGEQTKKQFVETAARLFQMRGYHGVGLAQLIEESGGPKGSFYYHFPGGKQELALASIEYSDVDVRQLLDHAAKRAKSPTQYIQLVANGLKRWLKDSAYSAGCPIAGLTLELASSEPVIARACADAYEGWVQAAHTGLLDLGMSPSTAQAVAPMLITALEGAVIMSRASRSTKPVDTVSKSLVALVS